MALDPHQIIFQHVMTESTPSHRMNKTGNGFSERMRRRFAAVLRKTRLLHFTVSKATTVTVGITFSIVTTFSGDTGTEFINRFSFNCLQIKRKSDVSVM